MAPGAPTAGRGGTAAVGAALVALLSAACESPLEPGDDGCAAPSLDPGITIRSGLTPQVRVALDPGGRCILRSEEVRSFRIDASASAAEYLVAVVSASETAGSSAGLALRVSDGDPAASRAPRTSSSGSLAADAAPATTHAGVIAAAGAGVRDGELLLRSRARAALARAGARPYRPAAGTGVAERSVRTSVAPSLPAVGDTVVFRNSVGGDLGVDCESTDVIRSVVRVVGTGFAVAEDLDVAGRLAESDYARLLASLDGHVYPVDTAYFGDPADLDGNGRIWLLLTAAVNRSTPRGSNTFVAGFFNPTDLADPESCPASNRGEVLYVLGPDPMGVFSTPVPVEDAVANAMGVAAHELEHLLSAQRRVIDGGGSFADLEDAWLGEGLAHIAETAVGLHTIGLPPGLNLGLEELVANGPAFAAFHLANLRRAGFYLSRPHRTPALGSATRGDPGGMASLEMRGFAWLFLRWLGDQASLPGGGLLGGPAEETMFRDLATGGPELATGVSNVERVATGLMGPVTWRALLSAYAPVPLVDDRDGDVPEDTQVTTLDLRALFLGLNQALPDRAPFGKPFPLEAVEIVIEPGVAHVETFELNASAVRYFILTAAGPHPAVDVALTTPGGAIVPGSVRPGVVILRLS